MPLHSSPVLMTSAGNPNLPAQSVTIATPPRWAPEEWPYRWIRSGSPPKLAALRCTQAMARRT